MSKRRMVFYLAIGIAAGLCLTACAGAAAGQLDAGNGALPGGPLLQYWQPAGVGLSAAVALRAQAPLAVERPAEMYRSAQTAEQTFNRMFHWCDGGD